MKIKKLISILLMIFGQTMFSQKYNGFYFETLANVKTTIFYKREIPQNITTPYFTLKAQHPITPLGFATGINIGYKFKNNNLLQFGLFQDESLSGIDFTGNIILPGTNFTTYNGISSADNGGVMITNLNTLFKKELFHIITNKKEKEPYVAVYFNLGLSYFYAPNNGLENLTGIRETSFYSIDSTYVEYAVAVWISPQRPKNSFKLNTGIEVTFGTRKKELFNIGVSFITNLQKSSDFSFSSSEVRLTDKNGKVSSYTYHVTARGNGFYYQISKRFYPFKWNYNNQQRKLQEFKKMHT